MAFFRIASVMVAPLCVTAVEETHSITISPKGFTNSRVRKVRSNMTSKLAESMFREVGQGTFVFMDHGQERTDAYKLSPGLDCTQGLAEITTTHMSLKECQTSCSQAEDCGCVTYERSSVSNGVCKKLPACIPKDCVSSSSVDTYMLHSKFKVSVNSLSDVGGIRVSRGRRVNKIDEWYEGQDGLTTMEFERAGGRDCASFQGNQIGSTSIGKDRQACLGECVKAGGCHCVRWERYYQQECILYSQCPDHDDIANQCTRSDKYDVYIDIAP